MERVCAEKEKIGESGRLAVRLLALKCDITLARRLYLHRAQDMKDGSQTYNNGMAPSSVFPTCGPDKDTR